jgi:hypothetical protein
MPDLPPHYSLVSLLVKPQVIHTYQQPKSTKGSHKFSCSYTLIDPSCTTLTTSPAAPPSAVTSVVLVFFSNSLGGFPPVKRVGDIVRLHRVKVRLSYLPVCCISTRLTGFCAAW